MTRTITANLNSHISYGSEFRKFQVLEPLLYKSPLYKEVSEILVEGAKSPFERINNSRPKSDLEESIRQGIHQSAKKDPLILTKLVQKDVNAGFQLPTATNSLQIMTHACITPYGVIHQHTIDEQGIIIPKLRAPHDQSFKFSSGSSVNSRFQTEKLTKLIYGDALQIIIHDVHSLCFHFPGTPILLGKFDFSAPYK